MDIGAFISRVTPVVVEFENGEAAHLGVSTRKLSGPAVMKAQSLVGFDPVTTPERIPEIEPTLNLLLVDFVAEWDLVWHGEPFPPTAENVARLSFLVKMAMITAINVEIQPDPKSLTVSPSGSSSPDGSAVRVPTGTPTSSSLSNGALHPGLSPESPTPAETTYG